MWRSIESRTPITRCLASVTDARCNFCRVFSMKTLPYKLTKIYNPI